MVGEQVGGGERQTGEGWEEDTRKLGNEMKVGLRWGRRLGDIRKGKKLEDDGIAVSRR